MWHLDQNQCGKEDEEGKEGTGGRGIREMSVLRLLGLTRQFEATDARDRVFGVLGLVTSDTDPDPMLRARFSRTGVGGLWTQRVIEDIPNSLEAAHLDEVLQPEQLVAMIANYEPNLDIENGPLITAAQYTEDAPEHGHVHLVFLGCHHLVVDLVSWRIILDDLEMLVKTPTRVARTT
jgi:hypothetical protein